MTRAMAYPMAEAMASPIWRTQSDFDATERDGTGRNERATKTTTDIPSVLDRSGPVDNRGIDRWMVADEQFELFIGALQTHAGRRTRLAREQWQTTPEVEEIQAFEEKTEQLRRIVAVERERWFAELRSNA